MVLFSRHWYWLGLIGVALAALCAGFFFVQPANADQILSNLTAQQCGVQHGTYFTDSAGRGQCRVTAAQAYVNGATSDCDAMWRMYQSDLAAAKQSEGVAAQQQLDMQAAYAAKAGYDAKHCGASGTTTAGGGTPSSPMGAFTAGVGAAGGYVPITGAPRTTLRYNQITQNSMASIGGALGFLAAQADEEQQQQQQAAEQAQEEQAARDAQQAQERAAAEAADAQQRANAPNPFGAPGATVVASNSPPNPFLSGDTTHESNDVPLSCIAVKPRPTNVACSGSAGPRLWSNYITLSNGPMCQFKSVEVHYLDPASSDEQTYAVYRGYKDMFGLETCGGPMKLLSATR